MNRSASSLGAVRIHGEAMLVAWASEGVQSWLQQSLPLLSAWKAAQQALHAALVAVQAIALAKLRQHSTETKQ